MKILRVITRLNIGGPAIQAIDLNRELSKLGHDTILYSGLVSEHEGSMEQRAFDMLPSGSLLFNASLGRELSPRGDWFTFKALRKRIKETKPDIIHTHMSKAGFLTRLAALTIRPRPKLVHTYHGTVFEGYFSRAKSALFLLLERFLGRYTDALIAISRSQKRDLVERYKIAPEDKVKVIPNGFDLSRFLELELVDLNKDHLSVGIVGRLTGIKNHGLFFRFVKELSKYFKVYSNVIGEGERREELEEIAPSVPPTYFWNWVPYDEMIERYRDLDIVVCSSKNEGTPTTLIEAMAAGRLVVATPVGGIPDLLSYYGIAGCLRTYKANWCPDSCSGHLGNNYCDLEHYRGILLKSPRQAAELVSLVIKNKRYKQMIINARQYVKERHSLDRLVKDITELYEELI